jgi:hypothetical protein
VRRGTHTLLQWFGARDGDGARGGDGSCVDDSTHGHDNALIDNRAQGGAHDDKGAKIRARERTRAARRALDGKLRNYAQMDTTRSNVQMNTLRNYAYMHTTEIYMQMDTTRSYMHMDTTRIY